MSDVNYYVFKAAIVFCCNFSAESMERDRYMDPQEALKFGLIDQVLEHPPLPEENGKDKDKS